MKLPSNIVNIDINEERKHFPTHQQYELQPYNIFDDLAAPSTSGEAYQPNRTAKQKHQLSYLLHEAREKAGELELKKADSLKRKREARSKYGW